MNQRENTSKKSQAESPQVSRARRFGGERINNDWAYLNEGESDPYESTDKAFNRSYKHGGLRVINKNEAVNDEEFNPYEENPDYKIDIENRRSSVDYSLNNRRTEKIRRELLTTLEESVAIQKGFGAVNKRKTMAVTRSIIWWGSYVWLFVQVPFAVFGIIAFAVIGGISEIGAGADANIFTKAMVTVTKTVIDGFTSLLGFNIGDMMEALFFITQFVVISVGLLTILIIFIQHILALNRPLSGNGAGLKIGALLIACIGYAVPILNIFPWILLWVLAIGKYPR